MTKGARPNILLITTDEQRFDTIAALGNGYIDTPHLDWLVDEGMSFRRAYADCPICMPSRATIMTGKSATVLGLTGNETAVRPLRDNPTLPALLTAAGYQTRAQGKMHFEPVRATYGFETMELPMDYYRERHRLSNGYASLPKEHGVGENEMQAVISTVHENDSLTHWTVARSIDFLETRDPTRPFFLWTSFTKPHPPFDPPGNYWALYANRPMQPPAVGDWSADVESMPQGFLEPTYLLNQMHRMSVQQITSSQRAYYACITHIDYSLGLLFARMRELGLLSTTWIIFTSDHGENLGDHHMGGKTNFMEGSAHVPLLVRPPAEPSDPKENGGRSVDTLVTLADLFPTILSLTGVAPPGGLTGSNLLSFVDAPSPDRPVFGECNGQFACCIQGNLKYSYAIRGGEELLFDLGADPHETLNLARDPEFSPEKTRLKQMLERHLTTQGSKLTDNGGLKRLLPLGGPGGVRRWPGYHSTVVETDVLH